MQILDGARPLIFGEVLFDRFPDGTAVLGGAPFNVAWHLCGFGVDPVFVSRVGNDEAGERIGALMQDWGMDTIALQVDDAHPTGAVDIKLQAGQPTFSILPHQAYDYIDPAALPQRLSVSLLYHGSLAVRNDTSHEALATVQALYRVPAFVDINLRDPWWNPESVMPALTAARWAKLNDEELQRLTDSSGEIETRAKKLQQRSGLDLLIVTRGAAGALARRSDGDIHAVVPHTEVPVVDTVGAGDAFAAVTILGLLQDWSIPLILERAQAFAEALVGVRGATVHRREFYTRFSKAWGT